MKMKKQSSLIMFGLFMIMVSPLQVLADEKSTIDVWYSFVKPKYFQDRPINEGQSIVQLNLPYRAEDASVVPVSINAQIEQTPDVYIKTLYLFADHNPAPLAGTFHVTPEIGRADLAMRIRIDKYTYVRVIAELNTGELHMDSKFIRATSGCSMPPPFLELQQAREHLGEMKFRSIVKKDDESGNSRLGQLLISHPNVNGLQLDQRTRSIIPADYVTKVVVSYKDKMILTAETDITISQDPSFRFFFQPEDGGELKAEIEDSKGRSFTKIFKVEG